MSMRHRLSSAATSPVRPFPPSRTDAGDLERFKFDMVFDEVQDSARLEE